MISKNDQEMIEFSCTQSEDEKSYTLIVKGQTPITWDDFAKCLHSFANDIESGDFFEDPSSTLN